MNCWGIWKTRNKTDVEIIPVDFEPVAEGATIFLGEYTLSDGDDEYF